MNKLTRIAALAVGTAVACSTMAAASSVAAETAPAAAYHGTVTAHGGLQARYLPTTTGKPGGVLPQGKKIEIVCKVRGTSVGGNNIWYELYPTFSEFVSARYVTNVGPVPRWCGKPGSLYATEATATVNKRVGPTTAERVRGSLSAGDQADVVCKLKAQYVGGNNFWYFLTDGSWVSARYLRNVGTIPVYCR